LKNLDNEKNGVLRKNLRFLLVLEVYDLFGIRSWSGLKNLDNEKNEVLRRNLRFLLVLEVYDLFGIRSWSGLKNPVFTGIRANPACQCSLSGPG
jgi:hypothetical protein